MMQRQAEAVLAQTAQPVARAEIAVVVPYYKAEPMLDMLIERLSATLSQITANWNVIFVDDRSPDNGWQKIVAASLRDPRLKGIRLSRNFGQHAAITAGMHHVNANWYVVMDCDLQDRPEDIEILYRRACEGTADVVLAERATAGLSMQRTAASFVFNAMVKWMAALDFSNKIGNFRIFSDKVAQAFRAISRRPAAARKENRAVGTPGCD